jgi:hypothetical protein
MNNKRVLQTAINELDKRKAPPAPKDIITDPAGQWKFPGQVTRIPSSTITMQGVPYPVLGVPNKGEPKMMQPGQYYDFSEADYVDEYPQMRKGGGLNSKKYTRSLEGIGSLFRESALFKKSKSKKKKFFHPNAKYFQDGGEPGDKFKKRLMKKYPGMTGVYGEEGENLNIVKDPNYDARSVGYGDIEFSFPGDTYLRYDNIIPKDDPNYIDVEEYIYSNIAPDKYNTVYNPRGANRGDVFLDMMHGMRDDPNYQPLLQNFEKAVKNTRGEDMDWQYEEEVKNGSTQSKEKFDENYVDGQLRAQLAPGTIGMFSHGRKDYRMERKYDSPEMRAAAKDIKNYLKTAKEEYIEADLTPEEIQEYAKGGYVIEDIGEYAEGGSQCPDGYVWDEKLKTCVENSNNIIWAKNENDPIYQDYLIKKALYDYSNNPNFYLRDDAAGTIRYALHKNDLSELKELSNPDLYKGLIEDATDLKDYRLKEYGNLDEDDLQQYEARVVDPNRTYYGSPVTYANLSTEEVKRDAQNNNFAFKEYLDNDFFSKYPPEYWTKQTSYDPNPFNVTYASPDGVRRGSSNYWTTPNTLFIEDDINRENLRKIYPNMPDSYIDEYIARTRKEPSYITNKYNPQYNYYESGDVYDDDYNYKIKTPVKSLIDDKGLRAYLQESIIDSIGQSYKYLPYWSKPQEVMFMPERIDPLRPERIERPKGEIIGTAQTYEEPQYNMPGYKKDYPYFYMAHHTSDQIIPHPRLKRGELTNLHTTPLNKIVQKVSGYNPKIMEGYYDEEGEWVPGEIESAQNEGRKITFHGYNSLQDKKAQKKYNKEYDEYLMATEYPKRMLKGFMNIHSNEDFAEKQAEGGTPCPPGHVKLNGRCVSINKKATAQDSLDLYNNAVALEKFYKSNRYKSKQLPLPVHGWEELENARKDQKRHGSVNNKNENLNFKDYYNQVDDYRFYQRDIPIDGRGTALINTDAPMALYDSRIKPNKFTEYKHIPTKAETKAINKWLTTGNKKYPSKAGYGHDLAGVYGYDPLSVKPSHLLTDKEVKERFKKFGPSGISQSKLEKAGLVPKKSIPNKPKEQQYPTSYKPVVNNTQQKPPEGKLMVGQEEVQQLDPKTGTVTTVITPVYENLEPTMPTLHPAYVNPELEKFIGTQRPVEEGWPGVMPEYDTEDLPDYATPDPDAEWVNQTERYIDWNANRIPYRLPKFRKPGHGGDLIKPGKKRYIPIPGIETRNSAYIQREDEEYGDGGERKNKNKNKNVKPFVTSDPDEYAFRKAAYDDSLFIANKYNSIQPKTPKYNSFSGPMGSFKGRRASVTNDYTSYTNSEKDNISNFYDIAGESPAWQKFQEENTYPRNRMLINKPIGHASQRSTYDRHALQTPFGVKTFTLPGETRLVHTDHELRYQPPIQPVKFVKSTPNKKPKPPITKKSVPPTPIPEQVIPIPIPVPPLVEPTPPIPPQGYPGVMPEYSVDELPMYATPDPDAEWVGDTRRYIDWDGNSVGYNLPRFRKPGHGGDLIRKGKRRYLHLPSIETRYEAEIVPEEEYAMGGEYTIGDEVELSEAEVQRLRALGYIIEEA